MTWAEQNILKITDNLLDKQRMLDFVTQYMNDMDMPSAIFYDYYDDYSEDDYYIQVMKAYSILFGKTEEILSESAAEEKVNALEINTILGSEVNLLEILGELCRMELIAAKLIESDSPKNDKSRLFSPHLERLTYDFQYGEKNL